MTGVLALGRLYCDLIFTECPRLPSLGTEVFAQGFGAHAGGGAFITAAHLASLGQRVSLATMLPPPPFDALIRADLNAADIDLSLSRPLSGAPQITLAMVQEGERAFLSHRAGPPCPPLGRSDLASFRHLHIGELASAIACPEILQQARAAGLTISLDCGWDEDLTAADIRPLEGAIDLFLPNAAEAAHLEALGLPARLAPLTVIKQGAAGATALGPEGALSAPAERVRALDTTGAGDAFNAGFLASWLEGAPLAACLAAGNRRGARAVAQRGGFCPDPATAQDLAAANP